MLFFTRSDIDSDESSALGMPRNDASLSLKSRQVERVLPRASRQDTQSRLTAQCALAASGHEVDVQTLNSNAEDLHAMLAQTPNACSCSCAHRIRVTHFWLGRKPASVVVLENCAQSCWSPVGSFARSSCDANTRQRTAIRHPSQPFRDRRARPPSLHRQPLCVRRSRTVHTATHTWSRRSAPNLSGDRTCKLDAQVST